jgi:hypothetical protein
VGLGESSAALREREKENYSTKNPFKFSGEIAAPRGWAVSETYFCLSERRILIESQISEVIVWELPQWPGGGFRRFSKEKW